MFKQKGISGLNKNEPVRFNAHQNWSERRFSSDWLIWWIYLLIRREYSIAKELVDQESAKRWWMLSTTITEPTLNASKQAANLLPAWTAADAGRLHCCVNQKNWHQRKMIYGGISTSGMLIAGCMKLDGLTGGCIISCSSRNPMMHLSCLFYKRGGCL